ncbi:MAG: TrkA C-terminal domain-containing protein [Bacilli bacterium]|nr:TrkA C-terminal domain-containing protein [Bacilli bacterium]
MNLWLSIALVLLVITIYMFVIEIFSVAFKLTGLATNKIKFQVASLFTGTGYTTAESELIAKDEKRRKIALACIYTGHIFSVAFMGLIINVVISLSSTVSAFHETPSFTEWYFIFLFITTGLFLLMLFVKIPIVNKKFQDFLESIAISLSTRNKKTNIMNVIDLQGKHAIVEVILNIIPDFAKEVSLSRMNLTNKYSVNILSIKRNDRFVKVSKDTMFRKGDVVVVYGLINDIKDAFVNSISKENEPVTTDKSNEISLVNNYGNIAIVEVYVEDVPAELDNVRLEDAKLKNRYDITIGFIERNDVYLTVTKDTIIQKGDTVTLFGPYRNIKILFKNDDNEQK